MTVRASPVQMCASTSSTSSRDPTVPFSILFTMSNNIIPDGVYNISNVKYTSYVVDLIRSNPLGTISGFQLDPTNPPHSWHLWQKVTWWLTGSVRSGRSRTTTSPSRAWLLHSPTRVHPINSKYVQLNQAYRTRDWPRPICVTQQGAALLGSPIETVWLVNAIGGGNFECVSYPIFISSVLDMGSPLHQGSRPWAGNITGPSLWTRII